MFTVKKLKITIKNINTELFITLVSLKAKPIFLHIVINVLFFTGKIKAVQYFNALKKVFFFYCINDRR